MMLSGAAHRCCGAAGAVEERLFLLTFHHSCAVPSGGVQMRFQSKGFSLVETAFTGMALGASAAQRVKSWARMPTAVQPAGTGSASRRVVFQPSSRTVWLSSGVQGRMFLQPVSRAAAMLCGSAKTA